MGLKQLKLTCYQGDIRSKISMQLKFSVSVLINRFFAAVRKAGSPKTKERPELSAVQPPWCLSTGDKPI